MSFDIPHESFGTNIIRGEHSERGLNETLHVLEEEFGFHRD